MTLIHEIQNTKNPDLVANIVFVHGLNGDAKKTWNIRDGKDDSIPMQLGYEFPNVGIWSIGYAVKSTRWTGRAMPLVDRATEVLKQLDNNDFAKHPIIFVTHSMGGLLVKQILKDASGYNQAAWTTILEQTRGVVFLSTPHAGSKLASWLGFIKGLYLPNVSIKELEAHNPQLRGLNIWYRENVEKYNIQSEVYYESHDTTGALAVDPTSADPGIRGVIPIQVDTDHNEITQYRSPTDTVYSGIKRFVSNIITHPYTPIAHVGNTKSLCEALAQIFESIQTLDNQFIGIIVGFQDSRLISNKTSLRKHLEITKQYIYRRVTLPKLLAAQGSIEIIEKESGLKNIYSSPYFQNLKEGLKEYLIHLGLGREFLTQDGKKITLQPSGVSFATGFGQHQEYNLLSLCEDAEAALLINSNDVDAMRKKVDEIRSKAELVGTYYKPELSNKICANIGEIRILSGCSQ